MDRNEERREQELMCLLSSVTANLRQNNDRIEDFLSNTAKHRQLADAFAKDLEVAAQQLRCDPATS